MKVLIWDLLLGAEHAKRIAQDGHEVLYYTEWLKDAPTFYNFAVGLGIDGVKKVKKFFEYVDNVDLICFFSLGRGDLADWLRKKGYRVYGAGKGERLETDRRFAKKVLKEVGLDINRWRIVKGVDGLVEYIKKYPGKWIKLNIFRGDLETFYAGDWEIVKQRIGGLKQKWGPWSDKFRFLVEDEVDVEVEAGWDLFFNGKEFLRPYLWGYCVTRFYIGKWVNELPEKLEEIKEKLKPVLRELDYRGAISIEVLLTKNGKAIVNDFTARFPYSLSYLYPVVIKNYTEVLDSCARGIDIEIDISSKYVGTMWFFSEVNLEDWVRVDCSKTVEKRIMIRRLSMKGKKRYALPANDDSLATGAIVGSSNSIIDIWKELMKGSEKLNVIGYEHETHGLKDIERVIEKGKMVGLDF